MTLENFLEYCTSKPGVTVDYPFDGECAWIKVSGKLFALVNVTEMKMSKEFVPPFHFANLKCDPEWSAELREQFTEIQPAWHQSKKHWNSIYFDGELRDKLIKELIDHSYELVFNSLTQKQKAALE